MRYFRSKAVVKTWSAVANPCASHVPSNPCSGGDTPVAVGPAGSTAATPIPAFDMEAYHFPRVEPFAAFLHRVSCYL